MSIKQAVLGQSLGVYTYKLASHHTTGRTNKVSRASCLALQGGVVTTQSEQPASLARMKTICTNSMGPRFYGPLMQPVSYPSLDADREAGGVMPSLTTEVERMLLVTPLFFCTTWADDMLHCDLAVYCIVPKSGAVRTLPLCILFSASQNMTVYAYLSASPCFGATLTAVVAGTCLSSAQSEVSQTGYWMSPLCYT